MRRVTYVLTAVLAKSASGFLPVAHQTLRLGAIFADAPDEDSVPFWKQGGFGKGGKKMKPVRQKKHNQNESPLLEATKKTKSALPVKFSTPRPSSGAVPSTPRPSSGGIGNAELRMRSKWGNVKDDEFYDLDDEGFEGSSLSTVTPVGPSRFIVREPKASVGVNEERRAATKTSFFIRDPTALPLAPGDAAGYQTKMKPPSSSQVSKGRSRTPGFLSAPGGRAAGAPPPPSWGDSLWDENKELGEKEKHASSGLKVGKKKLSEEQKQAMASGLPLTLNGVAERFRARRESSVGNEGSSMSPRDYTGSLFVDSSFTDLFNECKRRSARLLSPITILREAAASSSSAVDGGDPEERKEGSEKQAVGHHHDGIEAALLRNLLLELESRAVGSGTRALELTSESDPSMRVAMGESRIETISATSSSSELETDLSEFRPTSAQADAAPLIASGKGGC